jgi:hypothetical protein
VFIPLRFGFSAFSAFEKHVSAALSGIPFTLEYAGAGKPLGLYFVLFAAAALAFGCMCYALTASAAPALPCLPVMASLAFYGTSGFALASALLGISALLYEPLREGCRMPASPGTAKADFARRLLRELSRPRRLLLLLFFGAFAACAFFSKIPTGFALLVFLFFMAVLFFSVWIFSRPAVSRPHVRFSPVYIIRRRSVDPVFFAYMIPFAAAALLAAAFSPFFYRSADLLAFSGFGNMVSEADYRAHVLFQSSFSQRPLGSAADGLSGYLSYALDDDGLLRAVPQEEAALFQAHSSADAVSSFPQENAALLSGWQEEGNSRTLPKTMLLDALPALFLLIFLFPVLFRRENQAFAKCSAPKRLRWGDKKLKKILVYSGRRAKYLAGKALYNSGGNAQQLAPHTAPRLAPHTAPRLAPQTAPHTAPDTGPAFHRKTNKTVGQQ